MSQVCYKLTDGLYGVQKEPSGGVIFGCLHGWMYNCEFMVESEMRGLPAGLDIAGKLKIVAADIVSDHSVAAVWSVHSRAGGLESGKEQSIVGGETYFQGKK